MKRGIFTTLFGLFVTILYLVLSIQSYEKYDDGWGTDISMDMDLVVLAICGIVVLVVGLYDLYLNAKLNEGFSLKVKASYVYGGLTLGALTCLYPLGMMFKSIAKEKGATVITNYLECAIFGGFILAGAILLFLDLRKNKNN
ncbi:MAG: hypothetical protein K6G48_07125 [Acholeplasmatales bacterium]|nr:hypothetical protein [Acholeplasmatales bacterium]